MAGSAGVRAADAVARSAERADSRVAPVSIADVRPASEAEWDGLWHACEYATFFHSRTWAEVWSAYSDGRLRPEPVMVHFSDGRRALLPLSCRRSLHGLVKRYVSSPARTYGGWISTDDLDARHARLLLGTMKGFKDLVWRVNPYDPLQMPAGGVTRVDDTDVLPLEPDFSILRKAWSKGSAAPRLRQVKQALKFGVTVRLAQGIDDWNAYYEVYLDSLRRWGDTATSRYRKPLFDQLHGADSPHVKLWLACHDNEVIAGALCCYSRQQVSYWHGAALERALHMRPAVLLMHECIRHACENGFRWFDFNPSGGHEGVKAFKRSFGTTELPCPVVTQQSLLTTAVAAFTGRSRALRTGGRKQG